MKKFLIVATIVGLCGFVRATTINAPSSLVGTGVLNGNNAYGWGISIAVPAGQMVTSAQINFTGITLTAANSSGSGYLYVDLLNTKTTGVSAPVDGDAAGDYWKTQFSGANLTAIGTQFFPSVGTSLTWNYVFSSTQLAALNSYLASGNFTIGLDPDCHYNSAGISFSYTLGSTPPRNVPDQAATAFLVILGLAGVELLRRQWVTVKVNA